MKALKDCKWQVNIYEDIVAWWWCATISDDSGLDYINLSSKDFDTPETAKNNWIKFAELNGIKDYKII